MTPLTGISSMATRQVLADMTAAYEHETGAKVAIESVGGVDAAKRVRAGEHFDVVILASNVVMEKAEQANAMSGVHPSVIPTGS
jgi:molybdate transport system substrate-binding protein